MNNNLWWHYLLNHQKYTKQQRDTENGWLTAKFWEWWERIFRWNYCADSTGKYLTISKFMNSNRKRVHSTFWFLAIFVNPFMCFTAIQHNCITVLLDHYFLYSSTLESINTKSSRIFVSCLSFSIASAKRTNRIK